MSTYRISRSFTTRVARSERVLNMAEAFGLGLEEREFHVLRDLELEINPGDVVYITGQSGSGKSLLLRALFEEMRNAGLRVASIDETNLDANKALIDQIGDSMQSAIELLSRAGINDAYLAIRKPYELSDGQRYRLRLAKLMETGADAWFCDEWAAVLDRVTARTISYNAQKLARAQNKILVLATTHTDLVEELAPSLIIEKRYEARVNIIRQNEPTSKVSQQ